MNCSGWYPDTYQSAAVLNAIRLDMLDNISGVPTEMMPRLTKVANEFHALKQCMPVDSAPRNLPFYHIIQRRYAGFRWFDVGQQVDIETYYKGRKHSLLAFLLELIPENEIASTVSVSLQESGPAGIAAAAIYQPALAELGACSLSPGDMARLNRWIEQAAAGVPSSIVSPVCPDYSAERGEERRYRFTFQSLGSGLGLSGLRLLESIAGLHRLLSEILGCGTLPHHVCVGDFEALDDKTRLRLGVDIDEFRNCNRATALALAEASPVRIEPSLFTDHCGGLVGWRQRHDAMKQRFVDPNFGSLDIQDAVAKIAEARLGLYRRWFANSNMNVETAIPIVLEQGAEYAVMGEVIAKSFPNPLIVGADHHRMSFFYRLGCDAPVIYFDRNYD